LFFKISQNEIWKFGRNFLLSAKFGSERVKEKKEGDKNSEEIFGGKATIPHV